jgi:hypothetical protein
MYHECGSAHTDIDAKYNRGVDDFVDLYGKSQDSPHQATASAANSAYICWDTQPPHIHTLNQNLNVFLGVRAGRPTYSRFPAGYTVLQGFLSPSSSRG